VHDSRTNPDTLVLSLAQLRDLLGELAELTPDGGPVDAASVWAVVGRHDQSDLPLDVVAMLVDVAQEATPEQPIASMPLKRLEELINRIA
jgi:hypothetical protein